jgi:nitrate/TMAO reductase-like tetraheme cytochrome c subunit
VARRLAATASPLLVLFGPTVAAAAGLEVPLPRGWIGTTSDWVRGMGIAFVILDLVLLAFAWRSLRGGVVTPTARGWLFVAVGLMPLMIAFLSFTHGLESSTTVRACGSCHVMVPFVDDLKNVKSETLAATHYKNRFIRESQCYTCHSDYGLFGTLQAKAAGLGHVWRYSTGRYEVPIKIASPYPNVRCLTCHGESQKFLNAAGHPKDMLPSLMDGTMPCLSCHGPAHPQQAKQALAP